jgi:hypothetical protein
MSDNVAVWLRCEQACMTAISCAYTEDHPAGPRQAPLALVCMTPSRRLRMAELFPQNYVKQM